MGALILDYLKIWAGSGTGTSASKSWHGIGHIDAIGVLYCGAGIVIIDEAGLILRIDIPATFWTHEYFPDAHTYRYIPFLGIPIVPYNHIAITHVPAATQLIIQKGCETEGVRVRFTWR